MNTALDAPQYMTETLNVDLGDRSYSIFIGQDLLERVSDKIPFDLSGRKCFIISDDNVATHGYVKALNNYLIKANADKVFTHIVKPGEGSKSFPVYEDTLNFLLGHQVDRQSVIFALGGGVVGDLGGYTAATVLRGIPYIQIPTTLLSQVDSSVGGKTGINTKHGKNLVGSFYQPSSVICDLSVLKTLSDREFKAGYAEVVKYGLIANEDFFHWLDENLSDVMNLDMAALQYCVKISCQAKAEIVAKDEKEGGIRALLNLGHTFGHAFEASAGYDGSLLHGEAISVGMVLAHQLSNKIGLCSDKDVERVISHFQAAELPVSLKDIQSALKHDTEWLFTKMGQDKKVYKGKLTFILTKGIGKAFISRDVNQNDVIDVLKQSLNGV